MIQTIEQIQEDMTPDIPNRKQAKNPYALIIQLLQQIEENTRK